MPAARRKLLVLSLLVALAGGCASSRVADRPADAPPPRTGTAEEALQVTGGILKAVLSLFNVGIVVH